MFIVYGTDQLPLINSQAPSDEITNWKKSDKVLACYNKLHCLYYHILFPHFLRLLLNKGEDDDNEDNEHEMIMFQKQLYENEKLVPTSSTQSIANTLVLYYFVYIYFFFFGFIIF